MTLPADRVVAVVADRKEAFAVVAGRANRRDADERLCWPAGAPPTAYPMRPWPRPAPPPGCGPASPPPSGTPRRSSRGEAGCPRRPGRRPGQGRDPGPRHGHGRAGRGLQQRVVSDVRRQGERGPAQHLCELPRPRRREGHAPDAGRRPRRGDPEPDGRPSSRPPGRPGGEPDPVEGGHAARRGHRRPDQDAGPPGLPDLETWARFARAPEGTAAPEAPAGEGPGRAAEAAGPAAREADGPAVPTEAFGQDSKTVPPRPTKTEASDPFDPAIFNGEVKPRK